MTAGRALLTHTPLAALDGTAPRPARRPAGARRRTSSNRRRSARNVYLRIRHARLAFMWTLTYAPLPDCPEGRLTRGEVFRDLERFYRRMRRRYGPLRIVAVVERGARNGRLHVHLAVDRFLLYETVVALWGLGHVWVGDPGKLSGRPGAAQLAAYLAKYITKELEYDELAPEEHSYSCTRGWTVPSWRRRFHNREEGLAWLRRVIGQADREGDFGDRTVDPVWGRWLIFGDAQLWPPWDDLE